MNHFFKHSSDGPANHPNPPINDRSRGRRGPVVRINGTGAQALLEDDRTYRCQNGRVITVNPGANISVTLEYSNWTFSTQGTRKVVTLVSTTATKVQRPAHTGLCPGRACASVRAVYVASNGTHATDAHLSSCPTGVICSASPSHWTVVIAFAEIMVES